MSNKVKFGLKNTHYAVVTEAGTTVSYGTPKPWPGAVNLILNAAGENVVFYADDRAYFEENTNNGYDGTLEMALIPDAFRVDVLGETIDSNGALIENANAQPKKFALMFEFDGDAKKTRHVVYNVIPSRPNLEGSTKTNTKDPKTETMNISARPAIDSGNVKAKLEQGKTGYETFFSAVYLEGAVINSVALDTITFSKGAPDNISIDVTSTAETNAVKNVLLDGVPIGGVYLTPDGVDLDIDQAVFASLSNGDYAVTVEFNKGNAVVVTVTVGD